MFMRLLIVTQKVDKEDDNLGPFYYWFREFAKHFQEVKIIASSVGDISLPANVRVYGLGKERGIPRWRRILKYLELFSYHYARSDAVLFHQIPEYALAAAPFILSLKKTRALWYAHGAVSGKLALAERLVDYVLTSSPAGFRLPSKKVISVGQAIDTELFQPPSSPNGAFSGIRLLSLGRIAPVKNYETLIRAVSLLKKSWQRPWVLSIIGGPKLERDSEYLGSLKRLGVEEELASYVHFHGARPFSEIPAYFQEHDVFLNLSSTGSLDKAVLEAMASGLSVISANEAYRSLLPPAYFLERSNPELLAERIKMLADEPRPNRILRDIVCREHGLEGTVLKIADIIRGSGGTLV